MSSNLPIILGLFAGVPVAFVTAYFAYKQTKIKADVTLNSEKIDAAKEIAASKAEVIKAETERSTSEVKQIQELQARTITRLEKQVEKLEQFRQTCLDGQQEFQIFRTQKDIEIMKLTAQYAALEAQFKNVKNFHELNPDDKVVVDGK